MENKERTTINDPIELLSVLNYPYGLVEPLKGIDSAWDEEHVQDSALSKQVGGSHYKTFKIQPIEFIEGNNLGFSVGNIIKYACRYKNKGGVEDLKKVIHYAELLMEIEQKEG